MAEYIGFPAVPDGSPSSLLRYWSPSCRTCPVTSIRNSSWIKASLATKGSERQSPCRPSNYVWHADLGPKFTMITNDRLKNVHTAIKNLLNVDNKNGSAGISITKQNLTARRITPGPTETTPWSINIKAFWPFEAFRTRNNKTCTFN